jgi:hypothetical protein
MNFIPWVLSHILQNLELLQPESRAIWGNFSAQQMIEHLCGGLIMSVGKISFLMKAAERKNPSEEGFH